MRRIGIVLAAMAVVAALATACAGSSTDNATASPGENSSSAAAGPTLTIAKMAFGQPLTVAPGTEVTIVNDDTVEHSVTSTAQGAFDVHVDGGSRKTLTAPDEPGQYQFYCVYHPSMKGMLTVQ